MLDAGYTTVNLRLLAGLPEVFGARWPRFGSWLFCLLVVWLWSWHWSSFTFFFFFFFFLNFYLFWYFILFIFSFIFISWRLITLQYCSGFCHTLTWISHGFMCVPHPEPPSHLPPHPISLGLPSAPAPSTCLMHPTWAGDLFHTW